MILLSLTLPSNRPPSIRVFARKCSAKKKKTSFEGLNAASVQDDWVRMCF